MDKFVIHGGVPLRGRVQVKTAKNAVLPMMSAALLTREPVVLHDVPRLRDIDTMAKILEELGVVVERDGAGMKLQTRNELNCEARYELVSQMRASFCLLGGLLGRRRKAKVSLPGGCVIGVRPVDLHIKGLQALGADMKVEGGYVIGEADKLVGTDIYLGGAYGSTVTGTANVLMAAVLAQGTTVIDYAACEPEVQDLCVLLTKMGAHIEGIGSPRLVVHGVPELHGAEHTPIPDRIEAGTFMVAAAMTGGDVVVENVRVDHMSAVVETLRHIGVTVLTNGNWIHVHSDGAFKPVDLVTLPYPGFPTDLQAQFMTLLTLADGISVVQEKIYPDRFMHVAELMRLGANIRKEGNFAIIKGVDRLNGAKVMASDLRASAALVVAGLAAEGTTEISRIYHIDRGYEEIEKRLIPLGARIERIRDQKRIAIEEAA